METNNHKIVDYSAKLEQQYAAHGTVERDKFNEDAYTFYTAQILHNAQKEAKITQAEFAKCINATKS